MRVGGAQDPLTQGPNLPQIIVKGSWAKPDTAGTLFQGANSMIFT